jgi:hypothetical protein
MEFYSVIRKNEILSVAGKWMKLENIIFSNVCQVQKAKGHVFFFICETKPQYKYKQYYDKEVYQRGGQ